MNYKSGCCCQSRDAVLENKWLSNAPGDGTSWKVSFDCFLAFESLSTLNSATNDGELPNPDFNWRLSGFTSHAFVQLAYAWNGLSFGSIVGVSGPMLPLESSMITNSSLASPFNSGCEASCRLLLLSVVSPPCNRVKMIMRSMDWLRSPQNGFL